MSDILRFVPKVSCSDRHLPVIIHLRIGLIPLQYSRCYMHLCVPRDVAFRGHHLLLTQKVCVSFILTNAIVWH
jgi:hypothetical protein